MAQKFEATVSAIVFKTKARVEAVQRQSLNDLIDEMQTPVAKGGHMRVDTGFLRASGAISLTGMPSGPSRGDSMLPNSVPYVETTTIVGLASAEVGDRVYWGWTANYAKHRERYDGFMRLAIQRWQIIVDNVVRQAKARWK